MCNLLPGPHIKQVMAVAKKSDVPLLIDGEQVIQGSDKIIDYLDEYFPQNTLTPLDEDARKQSQYWEAFVDKEVGVNLRTFFYHTLLDNPDMLIPIFTHNGPWYGRFLMRIIFPSLRKKMIRYMRISDETAELAKQNLKLAIDKINQHLASHKYLAGNQFSRADLSAAALLAPLVQPIEYGVNWPSPLPAELQTTIDEWSNELEWVREMYKIHR